MNAPKMISLLSKSLQQQKGATKIDKATVNGQNQLLYKQKECTVNH